MKAFVAARVAGEDKETLLMFLSGVKQALQKAGIEPYITELEPPQPDDGKKLLRAFAHIDESDVLIVIYKPGPASEGMSAEVGYAYGRKPVWIYAQDGSESNLFALADRVSTWGSDDELFHSLQESKNE